MDAISKKQTKINLVYVAFIGAWCIFIVMLAKMNLSHRNVSSWILVACILWTVYAIFSGFAMRKKFLRRSAEAFSGDLRKALDFWKAAHIFGFCSAMNLAVLGFVLKFLGSSWIVAGIFFGLSFGFLLLWRPRSLAVSGG